MARIKAKPMARLPMGPVGGLPMKNSAFKSTPPPPVFDPAAAAFAPQQRYVYTNGPAAIPGAVSYNVFVSAGRMVLPRKPRP